MYSLIGAVRAISQTLSYEVRLIMIFLVLMILRERYSFIDFKMANIYTVWVYVKAIIFSVFC